MEMEGHLLTRGECGGPKMVDLTMPPCPRKTVWAKTQPVRIDGFKPLLWATHTAMKELFSKVWLTATTPFPCRPAQRMAVSRAARRVPAAHIPRREKNDVDHILLALQNPTKDQWPLSGFGIGACFNGSIDIFA